MFYLLWQKEMRELAAGLCNLLKSTRQHCMLVGEVMDRVSSSDEQIEGEGCPVLPSNVQRDFRSPKCNIVVGVPTQSLL